MADKDTIWTAVKAAYDEPGLKSLTNINVSDQTVVNDVAGTSAAEHVLALWPSHVEAAFDVTLAAHMAVALRATIAVLWERGGSATTIAKVKWDDVFDDEGLMGRLRRTGARGRVGPETNAPDTSSSGGEIRPWSHRSSMPVGYLPSQRGNRYNDGYWQD
jgi:hypothetical protein